MTTVANCLVVDVDAETYHADRLIEEPTLSASIAHLLVSASPAHAKAAHPRLTPGLQREAEAKFDRGTAAHALLLQGVDVAHVVHFDDWRKQDARDARELARAAGKIPLLAKDWDGVRAMVAAALEQLDARGVDLAGGSPEQTLLWSDRGVTCRGRIDWLRHDHGEIIDLKTTSRLAGPEWGRSVFGMGADIQAAMYRRAVEAVFGVVPTYRWIVVEAQPPYALSVFRPGADLLELADAKVDAALALWRDCLASGDWPAWPAEPFVVQVPGWEMQRFMEREEAA